MIVIQGSNSHLKSQHLPTVVKKTSDYEVHTLSVAGTARMFTQCFQNNLECRPSVAIITKEAVFRESSWNIELNLHLIFFFEWLLLYTLIENLTIFKINWHVSILFNKCEPLLCMNANEKPVFKFCFETLTVWQTVASLYIFDRFHGHELLRFFIRKGSKFTAESSTLCLSRVRRRRLHWWLRKSDFPFFWCEFVVISLNKGLR